MFIGSRVTRKSVVEESLLQYLFLSQKSKIFPNRSTRELLAEYLMDCIGYGAHNDKGLLVPIEFKRRIPGPDDVSFWTTHCGVCSAEVEWVFNRLGTTQYPIVPGHEVVGVVTAVSDNVKKFQVGDCVGVGPICNSCQG
jgi:hypothetical protein